MVGYDLKRSIRSTAFSFFCVTVAFTATSPSRRVYLSDFFLLKKIIILTHFCCTHLHISHVISPLILVRVADSQGCPAYCASADQPLVMTFTLMPPGDLPWILHFLRYLLGLMGLLSLLSFTKAFGKGLAAYVLALLGPGAVTFSVLPLF